MTNERRPGLRWGHPHLDELSRRISDFGACVFVVDDPGELDILWSQSATLSRNAESSGLKTLRLEWDAPTTGTLGDRVRDHAADLLILRNDRARPAELDQLMRELEGAPCALIVISKAALPGSQAVFDVQVAIGHGKATISRGERGPAPESISIDLGSRDSRPRPQPEPAAPAGSTIASYGVSPALRRELAAALGREVRELREIKGSAAKLDAVLPCSLLIVASPVEDERVLEAIRIQRNAGGGWLALGSGLNREQDRARVYDAGARAVLPRDARTEEIISAVRSALPGFAPQVSAVQPWESEMDELLGKLPALQLWKGEDLEHAREHYDPVLSHLLSRAKAGGTVTGALIVELPQLPSQLGKTGWTKLLQGALLNLLSGALRARDLNFMIGTRLVVVSHNMSQLAARAVVRRLQEMLPESDLSERWEIVESDSGSDDLICRIFEACRTKRKRDAV